MSSNEYDDYEGVDPNEDPAEDEDLEDVGAAVEAEESEEGAAATSKAEGEGRPAADDIAEAESLSPSAKRSIRQQLEDEVARFLAQGGHIKEVPPDDSIRD